MKKITVPIVHFGNEHIDNPHSVILELDPELLSKIQLAQQTLIENNDFRSITIYAQGELVDEEGDPVDFREQGEHIEIYMHGGVYYSAYNKHDDSAVIESDDFSELLVFAL